MRTGARRALSQTRAGTTLIEVIIAVMILSGVLIGLSNFTRRLQRLTSNHDALATASELATARLDAILLHGTYSTLVSTFNGTTETSASSANPPMTQYPGYSRATSVVAVDSAYRAKYVTVTVTVTQPATSTTVTKSLVIAAF